MNFLNNEKGVSEVIGALLIFLILVVVLGSIQVYEVPKWNKELERQNFDIVSAEFINLKSDIEDVSIKFVPKTSALHMGVRYPERFMLRNPGPAYGTLSTYPVNISVNYTLENGETENMSFHSKGIEYEQNGLVQSPKLVYEHGIMIRDFGETNVSTDVTQSLLVGNEIFIPLVDRDTKSISSIEAESLNIEPMGNENKTRPDISKINITIETKYPNIWEELLKNNSDANVSGNTIKINITGVPGKYFVYPNNVTPTGEAIYTGMIRYSSKRTGSVIPGIPPFSNINRNMSNYPNIKTISINLVNSSNETYSKITAKVYNVSSNLSIFADLTDLTRPTDIWTFNKNPDEYYPYPGNNTAKWYVTHPDFNDGYVVVVTFWVINGDMQFYTQRTFSKLNNNWINLPLPPTS